MEGYRDYSLSCTLVYCSELDERMVTIDDKMPVHIRS